MIPRSYRPVARLMRQDYGRADYVAPSIANAQAAREAYDNARRVTALKLAGV